MNTGLVEIFDGRHQPDERSHLLLRQPTITKKIRIGQIKLKPQNIVVFRVKLWSLIAESYRKKLKKDWGSFKKYVFK
jgi:hypothetical protein